MGQDRKGKTMTIDRQPCLGWQTIGADMFIVSAGMEKETKETFEEGNMWASYRLEEMRGAVWWGKVTRNTKSAWEVLNW
jgi:hypothetical protein